MAGQDPEFRSTEVGRLSLANPKKCKKLIFDALWKNSGMVLASAKQLGISKGFFWYLLRRHDMEKTPTNIRVEFLKRYRALDR